VPVSTFYETRYLKIAQTMRDIDHISASMIEAFKNSYFFPDAERLLRQFADAAKLKSETLRTDPVIFDVWPNFVVAGERLLELAPAEKDSGSCTACWEADEGGRLLKEGTDLITHIARARVPMPKSTKVFVERCRAYIQCRMPRTNSDQVEIKSL
jgi:hypothetical protein